MARSYSKVKVTIWSDPDFRAMPVAAQWLYFVMLTHPTITSCGVMDWREAKLVKFSEGMDVQALRQAAWDLGQKRLIAVDPETEEALVRSFVRHDGVLKTPNTTKALVREYGSIASTRLMELVSIEARRAVAEHPDWGGVEFAEPVTKQFPDSTGEDMEMVPEWFQRESEGPSNVLQSSLARPFDSPSNVLQKSFDFGTPKKGESLQLSSHIPIPNPNPIPNGMEGAPERLAKQADTRLPDSWMPTKEHAQRAKETGLDLMGEVEKFRLHAQTHDRHAARWNSAFTSWLKKSAEYAQRDQRRDATANLTRSQRAAAADIERYLAREQQPQQSQLQIGGPQ